MILMSPSFVVSELIYNLCNVNAPVLQKQTENEFDSPFLTCFHFSLSRQKLNDFYWGLYFWDSRASWLLNWFILLNKNLILNFRKTITYFKWRAYNLCDINALVLRRGKWYLSSCSFRFIEGWEHALSKKHIICLIIVKKC